MRIDKSPWVSGTLAQNGVFYRIVYPWQGWGGVEPDFDEIVIGTLSLVSAAARDGVIHQGLEYDQPYNWPKEWGDVPFAPRTTQKPSRAKVLQTRWERDRFERQAEKERLAEIEWRAAEIKEIEAQEQADRDHNEKMQAKRDASATKRRVEQNMGMTIKMAKEYFSPGPMKRNGKPDMSRWQYGIHAHPSLWLWED